jgi:hypothetical protein
VLKNNSDPEFRFIPLPHVCPVYNVYTPEGRQLRAEQFRSMSYVQGAIRFVTMDGYVKHQPGDDFELTVWTLSSDLSKWDQTSVGGMTPGMTKSSSLRARRSSRIKKRHHGSKDMKKRKRTARWAGFRLPRPVRLRPSRPALVPVRMGSFPASAGLSGFSSARAGFLFAAGPRPAGGTQSGSAPVPARSAAPWAGMREHAQRPRPRSIA